MNQHQDQAEQFDIAYLMETPEGVDLQVELAGIVPRTLAFTLDLLIRIGIILAVIIAGMFIGSEMAWGVVLIVYFLIEWFYPVLFEFFRGGQTPGKKAMGIMVVNDDLTPISLGNAFTRNLLRAADFLPAFYFFGFVSIAASRNFQRLGDIAAGTIVIYKKVHHEKQVPPAIVPQAPEFELSEQEQAAVVEFALRHESLTEARQHELANILAPVLKNADGNHPRSDGETAARLRSMGAWFLGARK